ncbi:hypothetical protein [Planomicrobium sp. CPCC 101110]|uniref:hypothetical protein n=1 Tax=Planomicrobium sp. CPCC 101110 TaxID=2599619 RepID=UPI0011B65B32|nr:hypothetical protein [Planomicrobium sp. CPCC 101110]TWT27740.1 hypothetical protein FQV30_04300 [Planomicrobium sp. CPCC 101110]
MKKYGFISLLVLILGASGYFLYPQFFPKESTPVLADETAETIKEVEITDEDNFPINYGVPINHKWEISFDGKLDPKSITEETVYVLDNDENHIELEVTLEDDGHSVVIEPPANGYAKGSYYEVHMANSLEYVDGDTVSKAYKMGFFVARDEVENVTFNNAIIPISEKAIISNKEKILVLQKAELKTELAKDDILKIPITHEVFEEEAIKIDEIKSSNGEVTITYSQPKFQELFEEIDIYNKILKFPLKRLKQNQVIA